MGCRNSTTADHRLEEPSPAVTSLNPLSVLSGPSSSEESDIDDDDTPEGVRSPVSDAFSAPLTPLLLGLPVPLADSCVATGLLAEAEDSRGGLWLDPDTGSSSEGFSVTEPSPMWWSMVLQGPKWQHWRTRVAAEAAREETTANDGRDANSSDGTLREMVNNWVLSQPPAAQSEASPVRLQ